MRNKFEHILLSLLLGISILLGLSFWMNTSFGFNIFYKSHWEELAKLQATNAPINPWFYISIGIALAIFIIGLIVINIPLVKHKRINTIKVNQPTPSVAPVVEQQLKTEKEPQKESNIIVSRPPRLNLPKNFEYLAKQKHESRTETPKDNTTLYNDALSQLFSENGYVVKPIPVISGFSPNLFAIGNNETLWIGGVDCKLEQLQKAIEKLNTVFQETLEDIKINISAFLIDTLNVNNSNNESILIVHSIDDLKKFLTEHPVELLTEEDQDNFNAYSEYIDTIIQYIKNL